MRPRGPGALIAALGLLLAAVGVDGAGAADDVPRYRIELVVFAREVPRDPHFRWSGEPEIANAIELPDGFEPPAPGEPGFPQLAPERPFEPVQPVSVLPVAERLRRLPEYRVLVVRAWAQAAEVFGNARSVRVHSATAAVEPARPQERLSLLGEVREPTEPIWRVDGTVTFERGRFPHLGVNLVYRRPLPPADGAPQDGRDPLRALVVALALDDLPYHGYRIEQRQRIQLGSLTYFDHPQFGVIATATRLAGDGAVPETPE